ncbi:hypothetical protein PRUPE_7G126300 [Prunus persica]|uniref:Carbonic anhydrase n=1 Tax=Prunus persica TaxID=3760 RepID=A0A251NAP6_PRUPE|nr:hypothetical protein PRUPE_7G126300 [Prunus persica]
MVESKQAHLQFLVFSLFLLYWHQIPIGAQVVGNANIFTSCTHLIYQLHHYHSHWVFGAGQEIEFDYRNGNDKGPEHWGELKKEWAACKYGKLQSPIDLSDDRATKVISSSEDLQMSYKPCNATMKNEGHYIAMEWEGDAGSVKINGTDYFLKQCHWHTPSEHSINGIRYDLELHMLHRSPDLNNKAVVALLFKIGSPNPLLSKVHNGLESMIGTKETQLELTDPSEIKWSSLKFYRYIGSLTTPPCTEGVIWIVNEMVNTVSKEQLELLKQAVYDYAKMNARPSQPLNDRDIMLYSTLLRQPVLRN